MTGISSILITDVLIAISNVIFLISAIPSFIKIYRVGNSDAQSLVHNEMHVIALVCLVMACVIGGIFISLFVASVELLMRLALIVIIRKYRSHRLTFPSDILYYSYSFLKKIIGV